MVLTWGCFLIFPKQTVKTEDMTEDSNGLTTTTTGTSVTIAVKDISEIYFVIPCLVILILFPIAREAKLGPAELEPEEESPRIKQMV